MGGRVSQITAATARVLYWVLVGAVIFSLTLPLGFYWMNVSSAWAIFSVTLGRSIVTILSMTIPASIVFLGVVSGATPKDTKRVLSYYARHNSILESLIIVSLIFFVLAALRAFWVNGIYDGIPFATGILTSVNAIIRLNRSYVGDIVLDTKKNAQRYQDRLGANDGSNFAHRLLHKHRLPTRRPIGLVAMTLCLASSAFVSQASGLLVGLSKDGMETLNAFFVTPLVLLFVAMKAVTKRRHMAQWFTTNRVLTKTLFLTHRINTPPQRSPDMIEVGNQQVSPQNSSASASTTGNQDIANRLLQVFLPIGIVILGGCVFAYAFFLMEVPTPDQAIDMSMLEQFSRTIVMLVGIGIILASSLFTPQQVEARRQRKIAKAQKKAASTAA